MILYPAIDLKDGACVRLLRGDMAAATVYNADPAAQAKSFADAGFSWLHLVDLNGAVEGRPVNGKAVESIIAATRLPVQLGGGIRNLATVEDWLARGVTRIVLGTAAVRDPALVKEACSRFPDRIAVAIDSRDGLVAVEGWTETSSVRTLDLALRMEDCGVAAIVFTDINRDGAMGGINLEATVDLAFALTTPVIASGGISSIEDLAAVKREERAGIAGVICGRALYDGRIDPAAALALLGED
jgi:phosphoribosylformimino-5-aminoimidazole carboxamide ribotide isomerase